MAATPRGDLSFQTVNGAIRVDVPDDIDAAAHVSTVRGSVTIAGQKLGRNAATTLGRGGRRITAATTNGTVTIE